MAPRCSRRSLLAYLGLFAVQTGAPGLTAATRAAAPEKIVLAGPGERRIDVTRWRPKERRGTVLFSHGALSSPAFYDRLILPWVTAGYEVWAPLHVDSPSHPDHAAFAGHAVWKARLEDMRALANHVDTDGFAVAGHSFGGLVALTLGGATPTPPPGLAGPFADPRAKAVVAFSPPGPMPGLVERGAYATVAVPALVQTGTLDLPYAPPGTPRAPDSWRDHLLAYEEPPAGGDRYALVLDTVDHYFGGAICNFDRPGPRQTAEAALAATIAGEFLDAYLRGRRTARRLLAARLTVTGPYRLTRR